MRDAIATYPDAGRAIGMTLCSGIGAPEVAAPWVDWRLASEIEKFPRAVLQHRLGYKEPADHNQGEPLLWGDMREVTPDLLRRHGIPLPNIIVAGTPCQAFSVAGARKGLEDPRGNLTLAFVDLLHAIVAARPDGKLAVLWENVPGVLSDKGNAFGCFLGGLVGSLDAIPAPAGGSWPREGMVEGPRSRAAWATLDAQWFGVAQRRERVFVVVDFGGAVDPAAVLLEPDSLRGDSPPHRQTWKGAARGFECGPQGGCFTDLAPTLDTRCKDGPIRNQLGAGVMCAEISPTLNAAFGSKLGLDDQHINGGGACSLPPVAMCLNAHGARLDAESETLLPVTGGGFDVEAISIPFDLNQITSKTNRSQPSQHVHHTLPAASCPPHLAECRHHQQWAVRRLMPIECARLQAFPDDWTQIPWRGKPADQCPDGPQYKALGNSMATVVVKYIMDRMRISMAENGAAQ